MLLAGTGMVGEAKGCEDVGKDIFGDVAHLSLLSLSLDLPCKQNACFLLRKGKAGVPRQAGCGLEACCAPRLSSLPLAQLASRLGTDAQPHVSRGWCFQFVLTVLP